MAFAKRLLSESLQGDGRNDKLISLVLHFGVILKSVIQLFLFVGLMGFASDVMSRIVGSPPVPVPSAYGELQIRSHLPRELLLVRITIVVV